MPEDARYASRIHSLFLTMEIARSFADSQSHSLADGDQCLMLKRVCFTIQGQRSTSTPSQWTETTREGHVVMSGNKVFSALN